MTVSKNTTDNTIKMLNKAIYLVEEDASFETFELLYDAIVASKKVLDCHNKSYVSRKKLKDLVFRADCFLKREEVSFIAS